MDTIQASADLYGRLKLKMARAMMAIEFLSNCKKRKVCPKFINLRTSAKSVSSERGVRAGKIAWLKGEISFNHAKLRHTETELYYTHLRILSVTLKNDVFAQFYWNQYTQNLYQKLTSFYKETRKKHLMKLRQLISKQRPPAPEIIPDFVVNLSSKPLSEKEEVFLNKGLKYAHPPSRAPLTDIIIDIESGIQFKGNSVKERIRADVKKTLLRVERNNRIHTRMSPESDDDIVNSLKDKGVIFLKADKGNKVVLMDRNDYDEKIQQMLDQGPYQELVFNNGKPKNPLNEMVRGATDCKKIICDLTEDRSLIYRLNVPNPKVASLYALPKIHKNPIKMRPISSNINVPTQNLSVWLLDYLKKFPINYGCSVKNSLDLVDKIKNVTLRRGHILCSFDLQDMFTNIPVQDAIECLRKHLIRNNAPDEEIHACMEIAKTCMQQNFFQFREKFYKQHSGLSMGSKLSPLLANLFMCDLEEKMKRDPNFPSMWYRYVDDVFCVINPRQLNNFLEFLNAQHPSITFTVEKEENGSLAFLDLKIKTTQDGKLEFSIYRKPTHTDRYITIDSHHHQSHKQAAFHTMIHRLLNIPMNDRDFEEEKTYIYNVAKINGYERRFVDRIFEKQTRNLHTRQRTTLTASREPQKVICLPFFPKLSNPLSTVLKKYNINIVTRNTNTLRHKLSNYKDKQTPLSTAGIYEISCQNCDLKYRGQSRRAITERLKEHKSATDKGHIEKSSVAEHMILEQHEIDYDANKRLKYVMSPYKLDAWESLFINNSSHLLMNREPAPISSYLFSLTSLEIS